MFTLFGRAQFIDILGIMLGIGTWDERALRQEDRRAQIQDGGRRGIGSRECCDIFHLPQA